MSSQMYAGCLVKGDVVDGAADEYEVSDCNSAVIPSLRGQRRAAERVPRRSDSRYVLPGQTSTGFAVSSGAGMFAALNMTGREVSIGDSALSLTPSDSNVTSRRTIHVDPSAFVHTFEEIR